MAPTRSDNRGAGTSGVAPSSRVTTGVAWVTGRKFRYSSISPRQPTLATSVTLSADRSPTLAVMRRPARIATTIAVLSALAMTSCGSKAKGSGASSTIGPTVTAATPQTSIPAQPIAPGTSTTTAGGPGTVTVAFSQPVAMTSTVKTQVECDAENGHFLAQASFPVGDAGNNTLSFSVNVPGYSGPKHYKAEVTVEVLGPTGDSTKATLSQDVGVNSPQQGAFTVSTKGENGRPIAGSIGWTCS